MKFAIIGGDLRIVKLAEMLAKENNEVYVFGLEKADNLKQIDRRFNVGMDVNGFVPVTLDELITKAKI